VPFEETMRGKSAEERRAVRQKESTPHCEALKRFLEKQLGRVSAKAPIAQAIRYALKHWEGLTRFLDDGVSNSIPTSSNAPCARRR
jgi:transposase